MVELKDQPQAELYAAAAQRYVFLPVEAAAGNARIVDEGIRQVGLAGNSK